MIECQKYAVFRNMFKGILDISALRNSAPGKLGPWHSLSLQIRSLANSPPINVFMFLLGPY